MQTLKKCLSIILDVLKKLIVIVLSFIIDIFGGDGAAYIADSTFLDKLYHKKKKNK